MMYVWRDILGKLVVGILIATLLVGCPWDDEDEDSPPHSPPASVYDISGTVSGDVVAGVTLSLSGDASASATTDGSGNYAFSGLTDGNYTVIPSLSGYAFTPVNLAVTISGVDVVGQDFTATIIPTYTLSGTVSGDVVAGVTLSLSGDASASATTDGSGNYAFSGLTDGNYTVTPSLSGYVFTPASLSTTISGADVTGQDFTAAVLTYTLSGTVSGDVVAGVTLSLSGDASATATTDGSGNYSFSSLANGDYTVTPSLSGYTFTPGNRAVTISGANVVGQNFSAAVVYTLSGTIFARAGTMVDSDVNDSGTTDISNDNSLLAQGIPNPVVIGGYANIADKGAEGNLFISGDESDYFYVYLAEGQTVSLVIADDDPYMNDLDLYIYRESGSLAWDSTTRGNVESIIVPTTPTGAWAGNYYIEVYAYSNAEVGGASNYVLSIGQTAAAAGYDSLSAGEDFVPGEVIVKFKDKPERESKLLAQSLGMSVEKPLATGAMLMKLPEQSQARSQVLSAMGVKRKQPRGKPLSAEAQRKMDTLAAIQALKKRKDVVYAEPNYLRYANAVPPPDDPLYINQWHYPLINLPTAWGTTQGSADVTVAVVDTGVLLNHPDLQGQLVPGYDFVSNVAHAVDGNGIDNNPDDPGDRLSTSENSSFHGTHVAGTVAATTNNGIGVAGVAGGVRIMPLRALGKGGAGTSVDIMQAVLFAAGLANDSGTLPAKRADVINLSLGGPSGSAYEQDIYNQVRNAGVIVVAAAGNSGNSSLNYPAAYSGVVSVSAVTQDRTLAYYSSYGSTISVAAPGGDTRSGKAGGVWSLMGNDLNFSPEAADYYNYDAYQGTSMASPHMAGVAALMKSAYPALQPNDLDSLLACGWITEDLGLAGRDNSFGYGLIDAQDAVAEAVNLASGGRDCSMLQASPSQLSFGTGAESLTLNIANVGSGSASIDSVTTDAVWLTVAPTNVDATTKLGSYTVSVDRTQLVDNGIYRATIQFGSADAETLSVPVAVQKITGSVANDAGHLYIFLINALDDAVAGYMDMDASNAQYAFSFGDVPAGEYYIVAGTDNNNDGFVCEPGEACGIYASGSGGNVFTVGTDMIGLDFEAGYDLFMSGSLSAVLREPLPVKVAPKRVAKDLP